MNVSADLGVRQRLQLLGLSPLSQVPEQLVPQGHIEPVRQQVEQAAQPLQQRQAKLLDVGQVFEHGAQARLQQILRHAGFVLELSVREDHLDEGRLGRVHHLPVVSLCSPRFSCRFWLEWVSTQCRRQLGELIDMTTDGIQRTNHTT